MFAVLPNAFGVSLGYGNDPLTFNEKTFFLPATAIVSIAPRRVGRSTHWPATVRAEAHRNHFAICTSGCGRFPCTQNLNERRLRALADTFAMVNWSPEIEQYTNRKCSVPIRSRTLETMAGDRRDRLDGWKHAGVSVCPGGADFSGTQIAEGVDARFSTRSAAAITKLRACINDTALNRFTQNRPAGWNASEINGWWSGFIPQTRDNHCAYTNAHAAWYLLRTAWVNEMARPDHDWIRDGAARARHRRRASARGRRVWIYLQRDREKSDRLGRLRRVLVCGGVGLRVEIHRRDAISRDSATRAIAILSRLSSAQLGCWGIADGYVSRASIPKAISRSSARRGCCTNSPAKSDICACCRTGRTTNICGDTDSARARNARRSKGATGIPVADRSRRFPIRTFIR